MTRYVVVASGPTPVYGDDTQIVEDFLPDHGSKVTFASDFASQYGFDVPYDDDDMRFTDEHADEDFEVEILVYEVPDAMSEEELESIIDNQEYDQLILVG